MPFEERDVHLSLDREIDGRAKLVKPRVAKKELERVTSFGGSDALKPHRVIEAGDAPHRMRDKLARDHAVPNLHLQRLNFIIPVPCILLDVRIRLGRQTAISVLAR